MSSHRIWAIRAGQAGQADGLFLGGMLAIGYPEIDDASKLDASRGAFKDAFERSDFTRGSIPIHGGQLFRFIHEVRIGDRVVYPRKVDRSLRWGEVAGPYLFDKDGSEEFPHRRAVRWIGKVGRDALSQGALYELGSVLTLFEVKNFADELFRVFSEGPSRDAAPGPDETEVGVARDIVETTNDFISKRINTELKGFPLEPFVAELFRAMGYNAHATRAVKDDGIDVVAHRDELGVEPPIIKVQVKAVRANLGSDVVKAFYAMIEDRDVGVVVTTGGFTAAAIDFARTRGNLRLVDGVEFVDLIQRHYEKLDRKYQRQIPLRRVLVPDVALDAT